MLTLWLSNNDYSHLAFFEDTNVMLYQRDDACYYKVSDYGDYATLYDAMLAWFNSAQSGTEPSDASSATTTNAVSRDSLIKAADSYVDLGGYLWYTAGGKLYRWREGGSVEILHDLPVNDVTDTTVDATLSVVSDQVALRYYIGGGIMGSFVTELYGTDGKQSATLYGYESIAISGSTIVETTKFPPTQTTCASRPTAARPGRHRRYGLFLRQRHRGRHQCQLLPRSLEIRDGYVYTTAVYDIDHQKTSDPLVTHSVRVNLKTGAQEILD